MADLLVIVPSRGRPGNIADLMDAWLDTGVSNADLCVATDDDDPSMYPALTVPGWHEIGPRLRLGPTLNVLAVANAADYKVVGFLGDDHRPRTAGWDQLILDAATDIGTGVIYGNDLVHGAALPTAAFLTTDLIRSLGYMCPPGQTHLFLDDFWRALGQATTLRYLPDVIIEHMHPLVGKAEQDAGYDEVNTYYGPDGAAFEQYMANRFEQDVSRLRGRVSTL